MGTRDNPQRKPLTIECTLQMYQKSRAGLKRTSDMAVEFGGGGGGKEEAVKGREIYKRKVNFSELVER